MRADWMAYVLGGLPGALLAAAAACGWVSEKTALALFVPSFIGLNLAHMASAWGHAYLDAPGWRGAPVERAVIPAALVLASLGLEAAGFGALLLALQYWLSLHHATMQNYGILRATQRRAGRRLAGRALWIDRAACVLLPLGALAYRARAVCASYDGALVPRPPEFLAPLLMGAGVVALLAFLFRELAATRRGEKFDSLGVALVLGTGGLWSALLIGLSHPALPLYALASGHYVQQLYFVWRYEAAREGFTALPSGLRGWLAPPSRLGYLAGLVAAGGAMVALLTLGAMGARALATPIRPAEALAIPPWLAAMIGVNLWHYWLEHRIWRSPLQRKADQLTL